MVVVNHHLFFADVMLRDEGVAELLPTCNTVILDEAHQLPETASCSSANRSAVACRTGARRGGRLAHGRARRSGTTRRRFGTPSCNPEVAPRRWHDPRKIRARRRPDARRLCRALDGLAAAWTAWRPNSALRRAGEELALVARRADEAARQVTRWRDADTAIPGGPEDDQDWIRWIDVAPHGFQLQASPLSVAPLFRRQVESTARAWIFTSATLAVGGDFPLLYRATRSRLRRDGSMGQPI